LIEPNVDPFRHSDFARARELIAAGEAAARAALPEIYAKLAGRKTVALRRSVESRALSVVRSVQLEGLRVTHQQLIRNEMKTRPGDYLRFNRLLSDLTRIFNTGLFEDVNYRLEFGQADSVDPVRNFGDSSILLEPSSYNYSPSGISNEVDIIIELQERAYGFYSLGIRYDNIDNVGLGIEVGQGNLLGSGASIRGVIDWGNPNEYRLGLTGTRLFRLPFGYRLDAFWGSRDRSYYENGNWRGDYNADQRGGLAEAGYILGHDAYFNIGINAYEALYRMPDPPFFEIFPKREWIIGPTFHMEFNNFNDLYLPARGRTYRLAGFYSSRKLKSSNDFLKFCLSYERIISVSDRFLLRPGIELGVSWGKLAWSEYFHTGGENLAGFTKNEFTTDQKAIFHLGTDFRLFQLFNHEGYPFYLQLFSNIATFQKLSKLVGVVNFDSILNWGVGIGVRTNTPIGPFQLILGFADFGKSSQYAPNRINIFISVGKDFRYSQD
jgi:outer membrane protein assembly factor BamA